MRDLILQLQQKFDLFNSPCRATPQKMDVMVVAMSTILVVRPRQQRLEWQIDERQGEIYNSGNTFFRVIVHQGCAGR